MSSEYRTMKASDGADISVTVWPVDNPVGVVQIAHGMAEYVDRYDHFARALNEEGYAVYGNDHRGHGRTAGNEDNTGYFADEDGWHRVVQDMYEVSTMIRNDHPGLPLFLFGHSMGSFLSRNYIALHGQDLQGVVLSGTGGDPGLVGKIGAWIAKREKRKKGARARSPRLDKLSFGAFNKAFEPTRTDFDWLSRDPEQVDRYVQDPYCGFVCTAGFFVDLMEGLTLIHRKDTIQAIPQELPILFASGSMDPVGQQTKKVRQVAQSYRDAGVRDVQEKYYEGGRHEILNEINRDQVAADIIQWMKNHMPQKA